MPPGIHSVPGTLASNSSSLHESTTRAGRGWGDSGTEPCSRAGSMCALSSRRAWKSNPLAIRFGP